MDLRRVRTWDWLTGLAGLVLLVSLFLPWYGFGGATVNAWDAFSIVDVILALAGLGGVAVPLIAAGQRTTAVPQAITALLFWVALLAAILAVIRLLNPPGSGLDREIGVWLGAIAVLALIAFDWRSMRDKSFPRVMRPRLEIETIPAPATDGTRRDTQ